MQVEKLTRTDALEFKKITGKTIDVVLNMRKEPLLVDGHVVYNEDGSVLVTEGVPELEYQYAIAFLIARKTDPSLDWEKFDPTLEDLNEILGGEDEKKDESN